MTPQHVTFDAHVHVMTASRLQGGWRRLQRDHPIRTSFGPAPTPQSLTKGIDEAGLQGFFNFFFPIFPSTSWQVNEWNDGFCSGRPKALPFLSMHPEDTPRERRDLLREFLINRQFIGVKVHTYIQRIRLDSDWIRDVCATLEEQKRLLYVHTGFSRHFRSKYGEEEMADHLSVLLEAFPELPVIAAHMLYPRLDIACQLLEEYPNLYLDLAGLQTCVRHDGKFEEWVGYCEQYPGRILFGSDSAFTRETPAETIQAFEALPLSEKALKLIGGENALRLLSSLGLPRIGVSGLSGSGVSQASMSSAV